MTGSKEKHPQGKSDNADKNRADTSKATLKVMAAEYVKNSAAKASETQRKPAETVGRAPPDADDSSSAGTGCARQRTPLQNLYGFSNDENVDSYDDGVGFPYQWGLSMPGFPQMPFPSYLPWGLPDPRQMAAAYGPQGLGAIPEPAMSEGDDPDDWGLSQGDSDSEETTMEGTPTDIDPNSLLGDYRLQFSEDVGPPLEKEVADTVNAIWSERRDPK